MHLFLVSSLPFLLLLFSKALPPWADEMRLLSLLFAGEFARFGVQWLKNCSLIRGKGLEFSCSRHKCAAKAGNVEEAAEFTVLDLPELALDCILGKLSPRELCNMASVCGSLRDRCRSDHMWEMHIREKWGTVIGPAARKEWERHSSPRDDSLCGTTGSVNQKSWRVSLPCFWPPSWLRIELGDGGKTGNPLAVDSVMAWYLALESGRFWFPAQVYNRENGHVGFMLSCYDAELSYDSRTDTFNARYPPHGRRALNIEEGVHWERLRAPPVHTSAHDLHASDCLNDLHPGDHIEIQWRKNKEFPFGWWYGIVGHLELCDRTEHHCLCRKSDTVVLEFNHYTPGSRWRTTAINRKDHREEGDETDGFYGGIRKLYRSDEISTWRRLWPSEVLE